MDHVPSLTIQSNQIATSSSGDRKQICRALHRLALSKEISLTRRERQDPLLEKVLNLSFDDAAERRLFCLELFLLLQDNRFPTAWNRTNLEHLQQLQAPHLPVSGLEDLLIPPALRERSGRSFYPLLCALIKTLHQVPHADLRWTLLLSLVRKDISFPDIAELYNAPGFAVLTPPDLCEVMEFNLSQLKVLTLLLQRCSFEDKVNLGFAFYFLRNTILATEKIIRAGQLIDRFIWKVLPRAEQRCRGFGKTYFLQDDTGHREIGYRKALEVFYLWLLHRDPFYTGWFFDAPLALTESEAQDIKGYSDFRKLDFELVLRYLPDLCLWEAGMLAHQNKGLLIHLAAGQNIRSFPDLCLPMPKKVAHAFHQLRPGDLCAYSHLNDLLYQLFGQYLRVDENILRIAAGYFPFVWVQLQDSHYSKRIAMKNRSKFAIWESVLQKWASWFASAANYDGLSQEDIWLIFSYIQHVLDEKQALPLKGATVRSLHRRALNWRREIQEQINAREQATACWSGAAYAPFTEEIGGIIYQVVQLTTAESLREEGQQMHHCVLSYRDKCARGECSIWSLRKLEDGKQISLVTMEITKQHHMVQVKGPCNQSPEGHYRAIIKEWVKREGIWGG